MKVRLGEVCQLIGARLEGESEYVIEGVCSLEDTGPARICFAEGNRYLQKVQSVAEGTVVIVNSDFPDIPGHRLLRVEKPRHAFIRVTELFLEPMAAEGIHPAASLDGSASIGDKVSIGACATVAADAMIGAHSIIQSGARIGPGVVMGQGCLIEANAVLMSGVTLGDRVVIHAGAVIGGEGFGFVWMDDHHHKVPQIGTVEIGDDVEIGCNSCVDRAALGVTRIRRGTKIDNLVQVGHNVDVGEHVIICGHSGLGGSATIANQVMIGGGAIISDHAEVGERAMVGGGSGVPGKVDAGDSVLGIPARSIRRAKREFAAVSRLPELLKAFKSQTRELEALQARVAELEEVKNSG
ncbi:MAG: UDP-3-O-(3-hydroxymyristoyl)glucosamine N-acyltransferase [Gammaproteobacteria bacterium]|nr:UDP-3-O-(3-hydroxymyristoyl)glucosamine N-acyltransferase [Gammaproteobacteria bacterium]